MTPDSTQDATNPNAFLNPANWLERIFEEISAQSATDDATAILIAAVSESTNPGSISSTRLLIGTIEVARKLASLRSANSDSLVLNRLGRALAQDPSIAGNFEQLQISYRINRRERERRTSVDLTDHATAILNNAVQIRRSRYASAILSADAILAAIVNYPDGRFHRALEERGFSTRMLGKIIERDMGDIDAEYAIWWLTAAGVKPIESLSDIVDISERDATTGQFRNTKKRPTAKKKGRQQLAAEESLIASSPADASKTPDSPVDSSREPRLRTLAGSLTGRAETIATSDLLNRENLTIALSELILNRDSADPFVIGLFGHWGSGKSSQVGLLRSALKDKRPSIEFVEFNAWKNERVDNLAAAFAQCIVEAAVAERGIVGRIKLGLLVAAARRRNLRMAAKRDFDWVRSWAFLFFPVSQAWTLPALVLLLVLYTLYDQGKMGGLQLIFAAGVAWFVAINTFISGSVTEWFKSLISDDESKTIRLPNYQPKLGVISEIHRTLKHICEVHTSSETSKDAGSGKYLLIVIDDLDRCEPKTVKEVLDIVRLVADIPRVVVLIAVDERLAFGAIEKHYEQFSEMGRTPSQVARDYLAKIMQVSVTLPTVTEASVKGYIKTNLFALKAPQPTGIQSPEQANRAGVKDSPVPTTLETASPLPGPEEPSEATRAMSADEQRLKSLTTREPFPEEHELFEKCSLAFHFSNPRLLRRLFQAWRLLRNMKFRNAGYELQDVKAWMPLLFWREWLLQQTPDTRTASESWIAQAILSNGVSQPDIPSGVSGLSDTIPEILRGMSVTLAATGTSYVEARLAVDCVLLPSVA